MKNVNDPVPAADVLEHVRGLRYDTPFFFTSYDILRKNYETFTHLFDNAEVYYALKANSEPVVLKYIDELGSGFEAASAFEIGMLLDLNVSPQKIIYGTSVKPSTHIEYAHKKGIDRFAADSKEEIAKIAKHAPGSRVFVRTIVDDAGSVFMMSERFGAPVSTVKELLLYAHSLDLKVYGISFYVGSQATHGDLWGKGIKRIQPVIEELLAEGIRLDVINIGGGFPVVYDNQQNTPSMEEIVTRIHSALHMLPYIPKILLEPGRGLVASSTVLVAEIIARNDRWQKPWLCLDAGIYNALYEAMIHQGATRYEVEPLHPLEGEHKPMLCVLAGPTGDSLDVIARNIVLPDYLDVGDKLVFKNTGAYSVTMASRFNGFPPPKLHIG